MQLEAYIACNCLETDSMNPPFDFGWRISDEGVLLPDISDADESYDLVKASFHAWLRENCPYGERAFFQVGLTDGRGYRYFVDALDRIDVDAFGQLRAAVTLKGNRQTETVEARLILADIAEFVERANFGTAPFLVNTATGEPLQQYDESLQGVFLREADTTLGIDESEFYIRHGSLEVFRARHFRQTVLDHEYNGIPSEVQFMDLETLTTLSSRVAISGEMIYWPDGSLQNEWGQFRFEYPSHMHIEKRVIGAESFAYIIVPLSRLCEIAIATDNPIKWTFSE